MTGDIFVNKGPILTSRPSITDVT